MSFTNFIGSQIENICKYLSIFFLPIFTSIHEFHDYVSLVLAYFGLWAYFFSFQPKEPKTAFSPKVRYTFFERVCLSVEMLFLGYKYVLMEKRESV